MTDALALVVAHELGHLSLKQRPYTAVTAEQSRSQEYEADAFAANLVERSGMSVIAGLTPFILRFAVNEAQEKKIPVGAALPPAECRMYRLGNPAIEKLQKSPNGRADFERSGLSSVSEFRQTLKTLKPRCAP